LRRARTDLDTADPVDDAAGRGRKIRQEHATGRAGQPAELASAYVLLASSEASYITGAMLPVTGGRPML
jgi:NAD(P)-dependent dehydrogenase (short-subunit alcohol dehydrogenase family)